MIRIQLFCLFFILLLSSIVLGQDDCGAPTIDLKSTTACLQEAEITFQEPEIDLDLSYQENLQRKQRAQEAFEQKIIPPESVDAFTQPYQFRKRDESNSHDRYQHNLDNFRLPVFTCKLPVIHTERSASNYSIDDIRELETALQKYYYCLNQSAEKNRETFKKFIIHKLDGKIVPTTGQRIQWITLPEHQEQTQNIMHDINKLYDERYTQYLNVHQQLQTIIRKFNKGE